MTSRKITIDNSVRYIPKSEQTKESDIKPKTRTIKAGFLPRKQNKNCSRNNKKFLTNVAASAFAVLTKYILYKYICNYWYYKLILNCYS